MGLRLKFNLGLVLVFGLGPGVSGMLARRILETNARDEVVRTADPMMGAALAVRSYTNREITPQLELQPMRTFLPQSLPANAETETFGALREQHPEYSYNCPPLGKMPGKRTAARAAPLRFESPAPSESLSPSGWDRAAAFVA